MDPTPYKNERNRLNRSRSSSCSSPFRQTDRFFHQEIYSLGINSLVRSYSSDRVWYKDKSQLFETIQVSSYITSSMKRFPAEGEENPKELRRLPLEYPDIKADITSKKNREMEEPSALVSTLKRGIIFFLATVATACAVYFYLDFRECSHVWDLQKTSSELSQNIFGQDQALDKINLVLRECNNASDIYVMVFTGNVGVGKTYASSIIRRNFPWRSNTLITYSENFSQDVSKIFSESPSFCGPRLIIVDDLKIYNIKIVIDFIKLLHSVRMKNENLLVILILQTDSIEQTVETVRHLKKFQISFIHVPFLPLSEEVVTKCYRAEIRRQRVKIPRGKLEKMVHHRMNYTSPSNITSGCKGVAEDVATYLNVSKT